MEAIAGIFGSTFVISTFHSRGVGDGAEEIRVETRVETGAASGAGAETTEAKGAVGFDLFDSAFLILILSVLG